MNSAFDKWVRLSYQYVKAKGWIYPTVREIFSRLFYIYDTECYDIVYGEELKEQVSREAVFASLQRQKMMFQYNGELYNPIRGNLIHINITRKGGQQ